MTTPTSWQAESKPIWLIEIGCPAVDKGANQPNVFYDAKSSESMLPYFSNGQRDDLIQRRYLEALISYWAVPDNNPTSSIYNDKMIDLDNVHVWSWDARPYPDFPARETVWSDGPNWRLGHWISGRVGMALLSDVVSEIVMSAGLPKPDVKTLSGVVKGYVIDRPMSPRRALETLAMVHGFDMIEGAEGLKFIYHSEHSVTSLKMSDLVFSGGADPIDHKLSDPDDQARDSRLRFIDSAADYQIGMVSVQNDTAIIDNVLDIEAPAVLDTISGMQICERIFDRALTGLETVSFTLSPKAAEFSVGDVVSLEQLPANLFGHWQIETLQGEAQRNATARRVPLGAVSALVTPDPIVTSDPVWQGAPQCVVLDIPTLSAARNGPLIGVYADPWRGAALTVFTGTSQTLNFETPCYIGTLLSDLPASFQNRRDFSKTIRIEMNGITLSSLDDDRFFAGGNAIAVQIDSGWEVMQFQTATLISPSTYEVSGLLRGQSGTVMMDSVPAGAKIVWLGSGLQVVPLGSDLRGAVINASIAITGRDEEETLSFIYMAAHLAPRAPAHLKIEDVAGNKSLSWMRQTRFGGDDWASLTVPLSETQELYEAEFYSADALLFTREATTLGLTLTAAELEQTPQLLQSGASVKIYQISSVVGRGEALEVLLEF